MLGSPALPTSFISTPSHQRAPPSPPPPPTHTHLPSSTLITPSTPTIVHTHNTLHTCHASAVFPNSLIELDIVSRLAAVPRLPPALMAACSNVEEALSPEGGGRKGKGGLRAG